MDFSPGTTVVKKDILKKHTNSAPHKQATELGTKKTLGLLHTLKKSTRKHQLDMA